MYTNIGQKVKGLACLQCLVGIVSSVIGGIILMSMDMVLIGLLILAAGSIISWVSSWVTYAIGEIAENTAKESNLPTTASTQISPPKVQAPRVKTTSIQKNQKLESVFKSVSSTAPTKNKVCPYCGEAV